MAYDMTPVAVINLEIWVHQRDLLGWYFFIFGSARAHVCWRSGFFCCFLLARYKGRSEDRPDREKWAHMIYTIKFAELKYDQERAAPSAILSRCILGPANFRRRSADTCAGFAFLLGSRIPDTHGITTFIQTGFHRNPGRCRQSC